MEIIEKLFENRNYDAKNITNKSEKIIPQKILDEIEGIGVTSETLDSIGTKVFKYMTQITIHGVFPELKNNYINGYMNIFQNKNLSIGVKYNAIDAEKKKLIYDTITKFTGGWHIQKNCSSYYIYCTSPRFTTKEQYVEHLQEMKQKISHVDKSLFVGGCAVNLMRLMWGFCIETTIEINAIYQKNVIPCIENICQNSYSEITEKIQSDEQKRHKEYEDDKAKRIAERNDFIFKSAPIEAEMKTNLIKNGFKYVEKYPLSNDLIVVKISVSEKLRPKYTYHKFIKSKQQKKFRYITFDSEQITSNIDFFRSEQQTLNTNVSGWIKKD